MAEKNQHFLCEILRFLSFYKRAQCNPRRSPSQPGFPVRGLFALLHLHNHTPTLSISWHGSQANTGTLRRRVWSEAGVVAFAARRRVFSLLFVSPPRSSASFVPDGSTRPICDLNADVQGQQAARSEPTRRPLFPANWAAPAAECQGVKMPKAQAGAPSGRRPPVETAQLLHLH